MADEVSLERLVKWLMDCGMPGNLVPHLREAVADLQRQAVEKALSLPLPGLLTDAEVAVIRSRLDDAFADYRDRWSDVADTVACNTTPAVALLVTFIPNIVTLLLRERETLLRLLLDCDGLDAYRAGVEDERRRVLDLLAALPPMAGFRDGILSRLIAKIASPGLSGQNGVAAPS